MDKALDEDIVHVLTQCKATSDTQAKFFPELFNTVATGLLENSIPPRIMTQFLLDYTSLNLDNATRIPPIHPNNQAV